MSHENLIRLQHLSLSYRAKPVLRGINWQYQSSQQWACIGPNGAGKTSLAKVLSGQARQFSGELRLGNDIKDAGIAYVCFEQQKALCERDKKLDDSEFRSDASDPGTTVRSLILGKRKANDEFHYWVERLNIAHILDRGLRYISTGEARKTLLIQALLAKPGLLILDSPLDGLDRGSQLEMLAVIEDLLISDQKMLLLYRQLQDLPAGISHLLVLDTGQICCQGPVQEVLAAQAVQALMNPPALKFDQLPEPAPRAYQLAPGQPLLELKQVNVNYGSLQVLKEVNWTVQPHQHWLVSGPNGCGKSTLLSLITGDNHKAYGQNITLFGTLRGSGESVWDIKQRYGVLDNALHLNWVRGMRVLEVVVSGFFDSNGLYDDWGDSQRQRALQWLAALGMAQLYAASFDALSFGLQRMVLLARAMVKSPAVLILDEPSLGLDAYHRELLMAAIDHIAKHSDTCIVFVSHSIGERPRCLSHHLQFTPIESGYRVISSEIAP